MHPGGPFWAKKDLGAWSISKGEYVEGEPLSKQRGVNFRRKQASLHKGISSNWERCSRQAAGGVGVGLRRGLRPQQAIQQPLPSGVAAANRPADRDSGSGSRSLTIRTVAVDAKKKKNLVMMGVSEFWQMVIKGVVIIAAVVVDQAQRKLQQRVALQQMAQLA